MIPYFSSTLIIVIYGLLAFRGQSPPKLWAWLVRLLLALGAGLAVASIDFFYVQSIGEVDNPAKYWEWGYPQFALDCMSLTLTLYVAGKAKLETTGRIAVLFAAAVFAFWLIDAGLFWMLMNLIKSGSLEFEYFLERLFSSDRITSASFLREVIIYSAASVVFTLILLQRGNISSAKPLSQQYHEVIVRFKSSPNEPARLLMAMAAAGRLPMIEKLRQEQEHPCQASPFSMDMNRTELIRLADQREEQTSMNRVWFFGLSVVTLGLILAEVPAAVFLTVLATGILVFRQGRRDRDSLVPAYQPNRFEPPAAPDGADSLQNLVTYAGYDPFSQFGLRFGSWVLMVDTKRPKQDGLTEETPRDPDIAEIERAITQTMSQAGQIVGTPQPLYFVQGANIPEEIKREGATSPPIQLHEDDFAKFSDDPNAPVRRYLWIRKSMWGREIAISYFLRLSRHGSDLNLEINGIIMPPVAAKYRWVDQFARQGFWSLVFEFIGAFFKGAWMLVWTPIHYFIKIMNAMSESFGSKKRARRRLEKSIERTANFDFGAPLSVRRQVADFGPVQYFQQMDQRAAETAFAGRVTRSFIDYLDTCGIDTSELREQRTTLLNQGIVVQGGDVNANNMAVGAGAKVKAMGQRARNTLGGGK